MRKGLRLTIFILLLVLASSQAKATHLMGGNLTYEYLGQDTATGDYIYRINFIQYIDCTSPNWGNTFPEPTMEVGFYEGQITPAGPMPLGFTLNMPLVDSVKIEPELPDTCTVGASICSYEVSYSGTIQLPLTFQGYHVYYTRCCRNGTVLNLNAPGTQGMSFHAFIPPSLVDNSSPILDSVTVPFICANDTNGFPNVATDPDGDQLIFTFVTPYDNIGGLGGLPDPLNWPIPDAQYAAGFSTAQPFGSGGYTFLNAATGNTEYFPDNQVGQFVVTIEITEYRGSNIVGITRRDMQLISISCPVNPKPKLSSINGSGVTNHTILEGDTLCFPVIVTDDFGDSLTLEFVGNIFDTTFTNPAAVAADSTGDSIITTGFCWATVCGQASDTAYSFTVKVTDNGCPPKTAFIDYVINVEEFISPDTILGFNPVCQNDTAIEYTVIDLSGGGSFFWTVTGGALVSGDTTNNVVVDWSDTTVGNITVISQSPTGCWGDTISLDVVINPLPVRYVGIDTMMCSGDTTMIGDTALGGYTYNWTPITGLNDPNTAQPMLTMTNDSLQPDTLPYIREATLNGCSLSDTLDVVVFGLPALDSIFGSPYVCPGITGVDYWAKAGPVSTFNWWITSGTLASPMNDSIKVDWDSIPGTGYVNFIETTGGICPGDTVTRSVRINPVFLPPAPFGADTICDWTRDSISYQAFFTVGSTYNWTIEGGTILSGDGTYQILVNWDSTGIGAGRLWFEESSSVDTLCFGTSDTLDVDIFLNPVTTLITGDMFVCSFDSGMVYSVSGGPGSSYNWSVAGGTITSGQGTDSIEVTWGATSGNYAMSVTETSAAGCVGASVDTSITIYVAAMSNTITGDTTICMPDTDGKIYTVNGASTSTYWWNVLGGSGTSTSDSISVDWTNTGQATVQVLETTDNGCVGDTISLTVWLDDPVPRIVQVTTNYNNHADIDVTWWVENGYLHNGNYYLYSKPREMGSFYSSLGTYTTQVHKDVGFPTAEKGFVYRVDVENQCGDTISSTHQHSIVLWGEKDELKNEVELHWNRYNNWPGGVFRYEIHRKLDNETDYSFHANGQSDSTRTLLNGEDGYLHCFRVQALKVGDTAYSWSNEFCVEFNHFVEIPTAFTPNGDGKNEIWWIDHIALYPEAELKIFNRWGNVVYHNKAGYDNTWGGTYNGEPLPDGTYFYILDLKWTGERDKDIYTGHVTIIR